MWKDSRQFTNFEKICQTKLSSLTKIQLRTMVEMCFCNKIQGITINKINIKKLFKNVREITIFGYDSNSLKKLNK